MASEDVPVQRIGGNLVIANPPATTSATTGMTGINKAMIAMAM